MDNNNTNNQPSTSNQQPGKDPQKKRSGFWRYRQRFETAPREKVVAFRINDANDSLQRIDSSQGGNNFTSQLLNFDSDDCLLWHIYFPNEKFNKSAPTIQKIHLFEMHFKSNLQKYDLDKIKQKFCFELDLKFLTTEDKKFMSAWSTFNQDLIENPEMVLNCAGIAMQKLISNAAITLTQQQNLSSARNKNSLRKICPRLFGFTPVVSVRSIKEDKDCDRLVSIRGIVIKVCPAEIICTWLAFKCKSCGTQQIVKQADKNLVTPTSCKGKCKAKSNFIPLLSSPYTRTELFQTIRIQETKLVELSRSERATAHGRIPKNIEVILNADLVSVVYPGDYVILTGILRVKPLEAIQNFNQPNIFKTYIQAVSMQSNKNTVSKQVSEFTEKDMQVIQMIRSEPDIFRLLVNSLCPTIYGNEMVKAGLVLALFGAANYQADKRSDIHILVVGDPGVGKSKLLEACAYVAPRGIYVCGNVSSGVGLTARVQYEKGREATLEGGALVLADQGVCCLDELDKMPTYQKDLLEVMEQQVVTISKSGVTCSLPARTSILAAANPSGGNHYDRSRSVSENLKMSPALLSRFDLVFVLLDRSNMRLDKLLANHIQGLHYGKSESSKTSTGWNLCSSGEHQQQQRKSQQEDIPLKEKLKLQPNEKMDLLPPILLLRYIAYARKNINPLLTREAAAEIKKFYLELRTIRVGLSTVPITKRQLEGLIRLSQARARLELCTEVTVKHVFDVLAIVRYSLVDVFSTDTNELQMERNINGSGMSQLNQIKKFIRILEQRSSAIQKTLFDFNELKEIAVHTGISISLQQVIESLNLQGILLKKGNNIYKLCKD